MRGEFDFDQFMQVNWKIPLFYRFLQVSPTYRMAFKHVYQNAPQPDCYDWIRLIKSAERFGDVWGLDFETWWDKHGAYWLDAITHIEPQTAAMLYGQSLPMEVERDLHHQRSIREFYRELDKYISKEYLQAGCPDTVILAIPVNGDADIIEKQAIDLLRKELKKLPNEIRRKERIKFQKNKIRKQTLEKQLYSIYRRAEYYPDIKLSKLAEILEKKYPSKIERQEDEDLRNLEIQTSELQRKALQVAEWAAVGEFPKVKKHDRIRKDKSKIIQDATGRKHLQLLDQHYALQFDWEFIKQQIKAGNIIPF